MSRILVVSSAHPSRNPRAVKEAWALADAGHSVRLLTVRSSARFDAADRIALRSAPFTVRYVDAVNGPGALLARAGTWLARTLRRSVGLQRPAALGPYAQLVRAIRSEPADLVIFHTELGLVCAQSWYGGVARVAVDFEDWYSEDLLEPERRGRPLDLLRRAEAAALRRASYCSAPSAAMAIALNRRHGGREPVVVRNTFPLSPFVRTPPPANASPRLVWFSQTIGPGRGLEWFVDVWARSAVPSTLTLIGAPRAGYRAELDARAGPRRSIEWLPPVPVDELPAALARFDVGLALEAKTPPSRDLTITNKLFQYLNAGLAVFATSTRGQDEVFAVAPDIGIQVSSTLVEPAAAQLDALLANRSALAARQRAARSAAANLFSWARDKTSLLDAVDRALSTVP